MTKDTGLPDNMQIMSREEHERAHLAWRATHLGNIPHDFRQGVTLDKALAELWHLNLLLSDYGIEHGGYSLLEQHTRLAMLAERENRARDLMKRHVIRAHRAEYLCLDMAEVLDEIVSGWDAAAAVAYEGGDGPSVPEPPYIAKARAALAKYERTMEV